MDRREFLAAALASFVSCSCAQRAMATTSAGCRMVGTGGARTLKIVKSSGHARLDRTCAQYAGALAANFGVQPGLTFYDDSEGMNALATPENSCGGKRRDRATWDSTSPA